MPKQASCVRGARIGRRSIGRSAVHLLILGLVIGCSAGCTEPSSSVSGGDRSASGREEIDQASNKARSWLLAAVTGAGWLDAESVDLAKRRVTTLMTAYSLLLVPADPDDGQRREVFRLADGICGADGGDLACWKEGFASIYLLESALRGRDVRAMLRENVSRLISMQNPEGGWAHSGKVSRSFYPTTVLSSANLALVGLGAARQLKLPIADEPRYREAVAKALELYRSVQAPGGSLPYGGPAYRVGHQAGRTAGALLGLAALGQADTHLFRRARSYSLRNVATIPYGHASPALHTAHGSLSLSAVSAAAWAQFREGPVRKLLSIQREDGSFADVASISPDSMNLGVPPKTDDAYRTAMYLVAMTADRSRMARSLRSDVDPRMAQTDEASRKRPPPLRRLIRTPVERATAIAAWRDLVVCGREGGQVRLVDPLTGRTRGPVETGLSDLRRIVTRGDRAYVVSEKEQVVIDLNDLEVISRRSLESPFAKRAFGPHHDYELRPDGTVLCRSDQTPLWSAKVELRALGTRMAADDHGTLAIANADTLRLLTSDGEEAWHVRIPAVTSGLTGPAIFAVAFIGSAIVVGSSDGVVRWFRKRDGEQLWEARSDAGVLRLAPMPGDDTAVIALTSDGRARRLSDKAAVWETDLVGGAERFVKMEVERNYGRYLCRARHLAIAVKPRNRIQVIHLASGKIAGACPVPSDDDHWTLTDRGLVVLGDDGRSLVVLTWTSQGE